MPKPHKVSYAQNREDTILHAFFPEVHNGIYIDVGANHPFFHSVTKNFYDEGWSGINIEPNPKLFDQLKTHRKRDINIQAAIGPVESKQKIRVFHSRDGLEGISTLSKNMMDEYEQKPNEDTKNFDDIEVDVKTLAYVIEHSLPKNTVIHFLKIDVEGYEYEVISSNDWAKFRPQIICIEANHIKRDWRSVLTSNSYSLVFNDGLNDYYIAKEAEERKKYFDYATVFLLGEKVYDHDTSEKLRILEEKSKDFKTLEKQKFALEKELRLAKKSLEKKIDESNSLQQFITEITPLKKHLKRQIKLRIESRGKDVKS